MSEIYADIASFVADNDLLNAPVESDNYTNYPLIPVGERISGNRKAEINVKKDGNVTIKLTFLDGLLDEATGDVQGVGDATYISTKEFKMGKNPGMTSTVARYLDALGVSTKGKTRADAVQLVEASLDQPVRVRIDWEDKTTPTKDASGNNVYPKPTMRTKDFNLGTPWEPNYQSEIEKDGKVYQAKHKFNGFSRA